MLSLKRFHLLAGFLLGTAAWLTAPATELPIEIAGMTVTPHTMAQGIKHRTESDGVLGVRVELFLRHTSSRGGTNGFFCNAVRFDNETPQKFIQEGQWAWHDTPSVWSEEETGMEPGSLSVWRFNTKQTNWGLGKALSVAIVDWQRIAQSELKATLTPQGVWFSSIVFTSSDGNPLPDSVIMHVANESGSAVKFLGARLFLPESNAKYRSLFPRPPIANFARYPADGFIPQNEKGCFQAKVGRLPLTYAAVQAILTDTQGRPFAIWAHLRVKREVFEIGGGWVQEANTPGSTMTYEPFLKTLQRLHVTTANLVSIPGYTDQTGPTGLYTRYPLKRFGNLNPFQTFEQDAMLPFVHAVEFLGEPQFDGGTPRYPQAVWQALLPFARSRLPTSLTLSDEATWRHYAGLSDYPHFEAYRVAAPAADEWSAYERWGDKRVEWGAPLETIGALSRSLRDLSRPKPIACWSQGPHSGWSEVGGRKRVSPTPDEIRLQAYHALSSRVTSLYWFNLSLRSLVQFRDTLDELNRIGREINLLSEFFIAGDAYRHTRLWREGRPDWDLASIAAPQGAVLFALDLDYEPDRADKEFVFKRRRDCRFAFDLPVYLRQPADVFRVDADGIYEVKYETTQTGVDILDRQSKVAIYVAAPTRDARARIDYKRLDLLALEQSLNFDPANRGRDFDTLKAGLLK